MKRTELYLLFLHKPGEIIEDAQLFPAFEQLVGCLVQDKEADCQPVRDMLSCLLRQSRIPDFDTNINVDFFGTQMAIHYLDECNLSFGEELAVVTLPLFPSRSTQAHSRVYYIVQRNHLPWLWS